jgi:hypothetical protein
VRFALILSLAFVAACVEEPSLEGRLCESDQSCPTGLQCVEGRCMRCEGGACQPIERSDAGTQIGADRELGVDHPQAIETPSTPAARTLSGSGRMQGGAKTLEVEIGHPVEQRKATGGTRSIESDLIGR